MCYFSVANSSNQIKSECSDWSIQWKVQIAWESFEQLFISSIASLCSKIIITYLKFKRFLCAKPDETKRIWNCMKMSTVSFTSISNLVKNIYVSSHKRNVITVIRNRSNSRSHGNSGERANCHRFIFGHHTEQQQVHKIKFKCHLNVLHLKKKR